MPFSFMYFAEENKNTIINRRKKPIKNNIISNIIVHMSEFCKMYKVQAYFHFVNKITNDIQFAIYYRTYIGE